jgi:hypothetical protein
MPLDARVEAQRLQSLYMEEKQTVSILLTGESGSGKTFLTKSAPFPVHIDSFDHNGTLSIRDEVRKGNIVVDDTFEEEDPFHPTAFTKWEKIFRERIRDKYFEKFAVYMLDSATWWLDSMLNATLGNRKAAGEVPEWNKDYHPQKIAIRNYLRLAMTLPCHFILTCHLEPLKDKEGNVLEWRPMFTGKGQVVVPTLFDEIWRMRKTEKSDGSIHKIVTRESGRYIARSRLSNIGQLGEEEPANLRNILKKAGVNYEDKERLLERIKE